MECYTFDKINRAAGASKEYNMWKDNIWTDAPRIPPTQTEWMDAPSTSPVKPKWKTLQQSTPLRFPPRPQLKTPEKSENPPLVDDLDTSPRTSTPVCDESIEDMLNAEDMKDQYECFKVHLNGSPKKLKVRGTVCDQNETIIAGHINMKNIDPFSYTFEQQYLPNVNMCFVNLLINGPGHIMCHEHYDPNYPNKFVSNCACVPVCNCRVNLAMNRNLPIGYKYDEHGFVVPTVPHMPSRVYYRDPNCIYTV